MIGFKVFITESGEQEEEFKHPVTYRTNKKFRELHTHLKNEAKEAEKHFGPEHHAALEDYKNYGYRGINKHLRRTKGNPDRNFHIAKVIDHLSHVTNRKTTRDMDVYRGISKSQYSKLSKGKHHTSYGFTSTSLGPDTARHFGKSKDYDHVLKIHCPTGTKGHYHSKSAWDEKEFLLHRGTKFKIERRTVDHDRKVKVIHMRVHSQDEHE